MASGAVEIGRSATIADATLTLVNWDWLPFNPFPSESSNGQFGVDPALLVEFELHGGPEVDLLTKSFDVTVIVIDAAGDAYPGSLPDYGPGPNPDGGRVLYAFANAPRKTGLMARIIYQGQSVSFHVGDPEAPLAQSFVRRDELVEAWIAAQINVSGTASQPTLRAAAQATRAALPLRGNSIPVLGPATPTVLPIALVTEQFLANGIERTRYHFADPNDVLPARDAILRVLDSLSLRDGLPEPEVLSQRLQSNMVDVDDPDTCTYRGVLDLIASRRAANEYVRWTTFEVLKWQDASDVRIEVDMELTAGMDVVLRVNAESVNVMTGQVLGQSVQTLSGRAQVRYVDGRWKAMHVGVYCDTYDPIKWP